MAGRGFMFAATLARMCVCVLCFSHVVVVVVVVVVVCDVVVLFVCWCWLLLLLLLLLLLYCCCRCFCRCCCCCCCCCAACCLLSASVCLPPVVGFGRDSDSCLVWCLSLFSLPNCFGGGRGGLKCCQLIRLFHSPEQERFGASSVS